MPTHNIGKQTILLSYPDNNLVQHVPPSMNQTSDWLLLAVEKKELRTKHIHSHLTHTYATTPLSIPPFCSCATTFDQLTHLCVVWVIFYTRAFFSIHMCLCLVYQRRQIASFPCETRCTFACEECEGKYNRTHGSFDKNRKQSQCMRNVTETM